MGGLPAVPGHFNQSEQSLNADNGVAGTFCLYVHCGWLTEEYHKILKSGCKAESYL